MNITRKLSYEDFRAAVVKAGRFSVFQASSTALSARLYTQLCRDPEIKTTLLDFPWTKVEWAKEGR